MLFITSLFGHSNPPNTDSTSTNEDYHSIEYTNSNTQTPQLIVHMILCDGLCLKVFTCEKDAQQYLETTVVKLTNDTTTKIINGRTTFIYEGSKLLHKVTYSSMGVS